MFDFDVFFNNLHPWAQGVWAAGLQIISYLIDLGTPINCFVGTQIAPCS